MTLRDSVKENNVDSFHRHLDQLERVVQNSELLKELLEQDGILCYPAYIGSNPMVETLIQKGVGKEKIYPIHVVGDMTSNQGRRQVLKVGGLINKARAARPKIWGATPTLMHVRTPVNCTIHNVEV